MCDSDSSVDGQDSSVDGQEPSDERLLLDHTIPKILIVGPTGSGKSSMANSLLGVDPQTEDVLFPVCGGWDSCTKGTSYKTGKWLGSGPDFTVIDTPGLGDSDGEDPKLITEMLDVLKNTVKSVDVIVLLLKGTENRFNAGMKSMLLQMSSIFGDQFWQFLLIAVSFWEYDQRSINKRERGCPGKFCQNETWFMDEVQKQLEDKFYQNETFEFAFIHSFSQIEDNKNDPIQQKHWLEETEKLWSFVTSKSDSFQLKGVDDILIDNNRLKREVKELKEDHEIRIGNLEDNGVTPIGTIIAWVNKPELNYRATDIQNRFVDLPDGWMKCDGGTITKGIWEGYTLPNLNGEKRFLRGGFDQDTFKMEEDTLRQHQHGVTDNGHSHGVTVGDHTHSVYDAGHRHRYNDKYGDDDGSPGSFTGGIDGIEGHWRDTHFSNANIQVVKARSTVTVKISTVNVKVENISGVPSANRGTETKPKSMCVIYIMKVW